MPLFIFEAPSLDESRFAGAVDLAARRFPEVTVEERLRARDGMSEIWVCRAPSESHVDRWDAAAQLGLHSLDVVRPDRNAR